MSTSEHEALLGSSGYIPPIHVIDQELDSDDSVFIPPGQGTQNPGGSESIKWQLATIVTAIKEAWFSRHDLQYILNEVKSELRKLDTPNQSYDSDSSTVYQDETTNTNKRKVMRRSADAQDNVPNTKASNQHKKSRQVFKKSSNHSKGAEILPAEEPIKPNAIRELVGSNNTLTSEILKQFSKPNESNSPKLDSQVYENSKMLPGSSGTKTLEPKPAKPPLSAPKNSEKIQDKSAATAPQGHAQTRENPKTNCDNTKAGEKQSSPDITSSKDKTKPPPVVIRPNQDWISIRKNLTELEIPFKTAPFNSQGIKLFMPDRTSYKKVVDLLDLNNKEFHTFKPREERDLHVVIRGTGNELTPEITKEILFELGYKPSKVTRMTHPISKYPMPLLLVALPREENFSRTIYNLSELLDLKITVEPLNVSPLVGQCRRCLFFGHHHENCRANYRCKHCAGDHDSFACDKKDGPRKCCNCSGPHRATYRGCKRAPKLRPPKEAPKNPPKAYYPANNHFPTLRPANQNLPPQTTTHSTKTTAAQVVKRSIARPEEWIDKPAQADLATQLEQLKAAISSLTSTVSNIVKALPTINA